MDTAGNRLSAPRIPQVAVRAGAPALLLAMMLGVAAASSPVPPADPVATAAAGANPSAAEEDEVLAAGGRFFKGMETGDAEMIRAVVFLDGQFYRVRVGADGSQFSTSTIQELIDTVSDPETDFLERIWDAEVKIHGPLATVWAPYDFYVDGEFSHCGIDAFNMLETDEGWKLANAAYTVEPTGCEPSPLGPPRH